MGIGVGELGGPYRHRVEQHFSADMGMASGFEDNASVFHLEDLE